MDFQQNVNLKPYNTFGISCNAKYFVVISKTSELLELIEQDIFKENKKLYLGGGSNILLTQDFDGLVVKLEMKCRQHQTFMVTKTITFIGNGSYREI